MFARLARLAVLCLVPLAAFGCADPTTRPQVIIVAVDGLEPSLIEAMLERQELPNIQRLIDDGSLARIKCVTDMVSPVVWTTVATGMSPDEHGITDFELDGVPVRSTDRRVPAFWNLLSEFGLSTALVGWMVSWPAEEDSGLVISDRAHYGKFPRKTYPPALVDLRRHRTQPTQTDGLDRFTSYPFDTSYESWDADAPGYEANFLIDRRLNRILQRDRAYTRMSRDLLRDHDLDLLALYLRGIDYVSHGFWQYFEPEPFRRQGWQIKQTDVDHLGTVIPAYYAYVDELVGQVLRAASREALVVLLSDHGFGTALGAYEIPRGDFLSGNHREFGVLILSGTGAQRGVTQTHQITHFDVLPTLLWIAGQPQARDFKGRPLTEYLTDLFSASASIPEIASYRDIVVQGEDEIGVAEEDEQILNELRSLGYIE